MALLHMALLLPLLWLVGFSSAAAPLVKRRCQDRCGDVAIPYPFGIGSDCYMNKWFAVTCNASFSPPKPFLTLHSYELLNISLQNNKAWVMGKVSTTCSSSPNITMNLEDDPHLCFSRESNRFTGLGCGVIATISKGGDIIGGCMSVCNDESRSFRRPEDSGCYGLDCCQAMIPYGLKNFNLGVDCTKKDGINETCKYAFLVDEGWFSSTRFSYPFDRVPHAVPIVLDWMFKDRENCEMCGPNSVCLKHLNFTSCLCDSGYEGNPYLPSGCTDVDECAHPGLDNCTHKCLNQQGSYSCSCPPGYDGDGRANGSSCLKNKWKAAVIIASVTGAALLFLASGSWLLFQIVQRRKKTRLKQQYFKQNGGFLLQEILCSNGGKMEKLRLFSSSELEIATDKYNENRILGRGGQGTVYKGMLPDGRIVAVKKSKKFDDERQLKQFIHEIVILSQIDHRNVVKLLGCCLETEAPLLVYEFMPNGNLFHLIQHQNQEFPVSWEMRLRIAAEVASAVSYLHSAASLTVYHRDIKSTNILLDEKFRAKVSDFGASKQVALDQTHLSTQVKGTFGYLDPQYFQSNRFTGKSDVYSFGVVLVELLTGEKPISCVGSNAKRSLAAHFVSSREENSLLDILDARVVKEGSVEEVKAVACLAKRCLNLDGRSRPSMKEVAMKLEGIRKSHTDLPAQQNQVNLGSKSCQLSPTEGSSLGFASATLQEQCSTTSIGSI